MIKRIKNKEVFDTVFFNQEKESMAQKSDDPLAGEIKQQTKVIAFGIKENKLQTYTHHEYKTDMFFDLDFISYPLILQFISGYYGVDQKSIINIKYTKDVEFEIEKEYTIITELQRQQYLGFYNTQQKFFKQNTLLKNKAIGKFIQASYILQNPLSEDQYLDVFNQISISQVVPGVFINMVKYNQFYKGKQHYPLKYYVRFPHYQGNHLIIQFIKDFLCNLIFYKNKLTVECYLIQETEVDLMKNLEFLKLNFQPPQEKFLSYRYQFQYNGNQGQIQRLINNLQQFYPRKTWGNQYILQGFGIQNYNPPEMKITFFPQQNNAQIQITSKESLQLVDSNIIVLQNYFKLLNQTTIYSNIQDLQLIDPITYSQDDRSDYEKLVNDIKKRPVFKRIVGTLSGTLGGAKGSPVYLNEEYDYDEKHFIELQRAMGKEFNIANQTFDSNIVSTYRCSEEYPYLNLSQTNGKDTVSCIIEPINFKGVSIYDFYDIAIRVMQNKDIIDYIRQFIYGRVSISSVKFSPWACAGRCTELSIPLKKIFGTHLLLIKLVPNLYTYHALKEEQETTVDERWFQSTFNIEPFETEIVYDEPTQKYYCKYLNPEVKKINPEKTGVYIQFQNKQRFLLIENQIYTTNKKHYYIPYKIDTNLQIISTIGYKYDYIMVDKNIYILTPKGLVPYQGDVSKMKKLKKIDFEQHAPEYNHVMSVINSTNNYIVNYEGQTIGTVTDDVTWYWKPKSITTDVEMKVGTYPIILPETEEDTDNIEQFIDTSKVVSNIIAQEMYEYSLSHSRQATIEYYYQHMNLKSILQFAKKRRQLTKQNNIVYYHKLYYLFSSYTESFIADGFNQLQKLLPNTIEMQYDYIINDSKFYIFNDLYMNKEMGEEIYSYQPSKAYKFIK